MTHDGTTADRTERVATDDHLRSRVRAVERALTDGADPTPAELPDAAEAAAERDALRDRVDELEERVAELEAATEALRGYAAGVRAVNEEVERRADLALATARTARETSEWENGDDRHRQDGEDVHDDDLASLLPDDPAVAAAAPELTEHAGETDRPADGSGRSGRGAEGNDATPSTDRSWGDEALDRLRNAL